MIESLKIKKGYATKLPFFASNPTITFKPGLNILFGPNGSGKSTILKTLAAYTCIKRSGWTAPLEPLDVTPSIIKKVDLPGLDHYLSKIANQSDVVWNGDFCFFLNFAEIQSESSLMMWADESSGFRFRDDKESISAMLAHSKLSGGQVQITNINRFLNHIESVPTLDGYRTIWAKHNSAWAEAAQAFVKYIEERKLAFPAMEQRHTLLLDEPDSNLSYTNQQLLMNVLVRLAEKHNFQVIVATHSPFALQYKDDMIALEPDYVEKSIEAFRTLSSVL